MIFGDLVDLKLLDISLTGEKTPERTLPRKLVLTGDRTRAHCVTGPHATACSTAVDSSLYNRQNRKNIVFLQRTLGLRLFGNYCRLY